MSKHNWLMQGLLTNFDVYNQMLYGMIDEVRGNEAKENELNKMICEVIMIMNELTLEEFNEKVEGYEKFNLSEELSKFCSDAKRMAKSLEAVLMKDKSLVCDTSVEYLNAFAPHCKIQNREDQVVVDIIVMYIMDYMNGVERRSKSTN